MDKILIFVLILAVFLGIAGCQTPARVDTDEDILLDDNAVYDNGNVLQGTVTEATDSYFILETDDRLLYSIPQDPEKADGHLVYQGDTVEIFHNGIVMESWPMQLGKVYKINILRE